MIEQEIHLLGGTPFAKGYNRIVHGQRGDYVEFEKEQIIPELCHFFGHLPPEDRDVYYWWLYPEGHRETKVYFQRRTVKYADYKVGKYYVSPYLLKDFQDPEQLFGYRNETNNR